MKRKTSLLPIILLLTLSVGTVLPAPINQPSTEQTPYEVDKTWHLGTLNFTVGPLLVYNINFTDGQLEFTVENIPRNVSAIEIPAEITYNPNFTSPFSIPKYIKWELKDTDVLGSGYAICFPNGKILNNPHNNIGVYFPKNEVNRTIYLDGQVSVTPILHRLFPFLKGASHRIPNPPKYYTLHLKRVNNSNNSNPNSNPSPNWNWIGENFVYYVDNSSYINISTVNESLFRMNIRNLLKNLQGIRLIYTFAADSGNSKLDIYSE